jgi:hypothetical protein
MIQSGDLLLWRVDSNAGWVDRLIGWGESLIKQRTPQGYQYYHVAFVSANPAFMYSSQPPKIDLYPIPDPLPQNVEVWRLKESVSPEGLSNVFRYAESRRGRLYPFLGVLSAGWLQGNLEFCSQYTEDSFCEYPVALCEDIRFTSPDDIAASNLIKRIIPP